MKIGKKSQMKLLKLLKKFKKGHLKFSLSALIFFLIAFGISCEDKVPSQIVNNNILNFSEITISNEKLEVSKKNSRYNIGRDGSLFFGENEDVKTYSILKFTGMNLIPDTLDEVLDLKLTLYMNKTLPVDTTDNNNYINIWRINNLDGISWSEDDWTNSINFENLEKELLTTYHIDNNDTCEIVLDTSLVRFWTDSLNSEGGIILESDVNNGSIFQSVYSIDNTTKKPVIYVNYRVEEDTTEGYYNPTDDVTFSFDKKPDEIRDFLAVSEVYEEAIFLKFDVKDLMADPDSNVFIPEARLKLYIDQTNTKNYQDNIYLNYALLDTNDYYENYLYDNPVAISGISVGYEDSIAIFDIKSTVQTFISTNSENMGMLIWSAAITNDMSSISFFGQDADSSKRPELKVLFAKEEK